MGRAESRKTENGTNVNGEQTFDIDGDGVYDIGLEVSNNGMAFCITIRNPLKNGNYNVKFGSRVCSVMTNWSFRKEA